MSNNIGNLLVGFGLDLTRLQKDAPEAFRILNSQTLGMSAEMKRASREGAESFRLIDEALGIHVSRPLTRILTQEFPGLASALQSIIGVGIGGAVLAAGVEGFEKVAQKIERAQKAEEEFQSATRKVGEVFTDAMQSFEKADKLRGLTGIDKKLFEIDYSAVEEGRKKIDELAAAMTKESVAAADAHKWTTEFLAGIGNVAHVVFTSQSSLGIEEIQKQFSSFTQRFDELSKLDALKGTHESAKYVEQQIEKAKADLASMTEMKLTGTQETINSVAKFVPGQVPMMGFSQAELDTQKQFIDNLQKIHALLNASANDQKGREDEARVAAAKEALDKEIASIHAADAATEHWTESLVKQHAVAVPPKDQFAQFDDAVRQAEIHYTSLYHAIGEQAFYVRFHESLQQVIADMRELDGQKITAPAVTLPQFTGTAAPAGSGFQLPLPAVPVAPTLGAGGTTASQFDVFSKDQAAQLKAAAAAFADVVTPQQKYQLAQQELNLLLEKGLIDQTAFTAAMQKASDALVQADDHLHKMQEDLQKLLERSTSASAGVQAFFLQLQIDAGQNGKFAFEILNTGLKSFEDQLTKLIFDGKAKWKDFFKSLTEEAFKFTLNKEISGLFQAAGNSSIGKSLGLGSLIPNIGGAGAAGGAQLAAAATTLQTGSTTLQVAATQLQAAAASLNAGGAGSVAGAAGGGEDESFFSDIPGFASGTDNAPGGFAWVGEQGPELLNLPAGSSVTPAASVKSGGGDQHFYIDAKGAEIGVEEKIVRALAAARPRFIGEAVANFNEIQRRSVQQR